MKKFLLIFVVILTFSTLQAADLVNRDDFSIFDQSINLTSNFFEFEVELDDNGEFGVVVHNDYGAYLMRYDASGDIKNLLNINPNNVPIGNVNLLTNLTTDRRLIPFTDTTQDFFIYNYNDALNQIGDPICLSCDYPDLSVFGILDANCDINSSDEYVGASWGIDASGVSIVEKIFTFQYDLNNQTTNGLYTVDQLSDPLKKVNPSWDYHIKEDVLVKVAESGNFVVSWLGKTSFGTQNVFYVVFGASGNPITEVLIADCDCNDGYDAATCVETKSRLISIDMEADGDFYLSWQGQSGDFGIYNNVYMRGFNADGTPKYPAVKVNSEVMEFKDGIIRTDVACDDMGNVIVIWNSNLHTNNPYEYTDIYAQKISPTGTFVGNNSRINDYYATAYINPNLEVDMNNSGQVLVAWLNPDQKFDQPVLTAELFEYNSIGNFTPGDINYDMQGDISDVLNLVDYMFANVGYKYYPKNLLDFNGDGDVGDITDLLYYVDYFFANGPAPVDPYSN